MFIRHPRVPRLIASWLLVQTLSQLAWPTASYALTSGPTAPEATSFEPVDTTDMVNLNSGDLTYNIPLLEVPGPEGGYPLSLSYHGGIQPNEEASWVGLGWSLNPGAIHRNVNGYADDHQDVQQVNRDYWEGGSTTTNSIGVSVGFNGFNGQPTGVSFGLSFSQDTYRGFGLGSRIGADIGPVGFSVADNGYGNMSAGVDLSMGKTVGGATDGGVRLGGSIGLSVNGDKVSTNAGVGISASNGPNSRSFSLLGASISSNGGKPSFTVGGGSAGIRNDKAGLIQTQSDNFGISVPVFPGVFVSYAYNYTRYWSDETAAAYTNGSLYFPTSYNSEGYYDEHAFDMYRLPDPYTENFIDNPNPNYIQGGSFPEYDDYYVTAQGLSGSMRPYAFQHALVDRTFKQPNDEVAVASKSIAFTNKKLNFRFANDFSNQYRQQAGSGWNTGSGTTTYPFDPSPIYGNNDGSFGYDAATNRLIGSKHVEWFTNAAISNGTAAVQGFVNTSSPGFVRATNTQIGGFMITNESGVTYHYALPAYSYNEHVYGEVVDKSGGSRFTHLTKPEKYAYTWYLTAVTGPDYVDRGSPGLDASDWGYWVNFSYGKWASDYNWRNPSEGFHRDLDGAFQRFSMGQKELYYLNSISTRTHTALFEKAFRADGKGVANLGEIQTAEPHFEQPSYRLVSKITPSRYTNSYYQYYQNLYYPQLQLRLNRILLFQNKDLPTSSNQLCTASTAYNSYDTNGAIAGSTTWVTTYGYAHNGAYVLDKEDINVLGKEFVAKAIRVISLQHDYSLTPSTTNSYGNEQMPYGDANTSLTGKLTLSALNFGGLSGIGMLPPTRFYYDLPTTVKEQVQVNQSETATNPVPADNFLGNITLSATSSLRPGDVIKLYSGTAVVSYATILNQVGSQVNTTTYPVRYLKTVPPTIGAYQATATKNPPYLMSNVDNWGMFKSDFEADFTGIAENGIAHTTTELSSKNTDAWSLRRISSPLGADINISYAPDEYQAPILAQPRMLSLANGYAGTQNDANNNIGLLFLNNYTYTQAKYLFLPNQIISVTGVAGDADNYNTVRNCTFKPDIPMQVLEVININGYAELRVKALVNNIFYWTCQNYNSGYTSCFGGGIIAGYIKAAATTNAPLYGGGLRVSSVSVNTGQVQHKTSYNYNSSGVTSYEPLSYYSIDTPDYRALASYTGADANIIQAVARAYRDDYLSQLAKLLVIAREVVPPGIMYKRVTVSESVKNGSDVFANTGSIDYQFTVFDRSMVGVVGSGYSSTSISNGSPFGGTVEFRKRQMAIKDLTSRMGNLERVTHYDALGKTLTQTVNQYASDNILPTSNANLDSPEPTGYIAQVANNYEQKLAAYNYQGLIKESYGDYRRVRRNDGYYDVKGNISQRETYPNIQIGTTTTDYRTGIQTTAQTLGFDFYSGTATSTLDIDGYGNRWLSKTVPAYRWYPALRPTGSPAANGSAPNRNMLSQTAATYVYKADATNTPVKLRSASVQTWSDVVAIVDTDPTQAFSSSTQAGIWRPQATYTWLPTTKSADGLTALNDFIDFPLLSRYPSAPWKKSSEITRYNTYSNALEVKDVNGQYLATKTGFNQAKVLVSGGPAHYEELAYTGAEEADLEHPDRYFSGGVAITWGPNSTLPDGGDPWGSGDVERSTSTAHTGQASVRIGPWKHGLSYSVNASTTDPSKFALDPSQPYRASVWASDPSAYLYYWLDGAYSPASAAVVRQRSSDGWYLLELTIPPIGANRTTLRVGCYNPDASPKRIPGSTQSTTSIFFDDFRFQPVNAQVSSYVYNNHTGQVTDILDNNNLFTHYDYDEVGSLRRVTRETLQYGAKSVAEHEYAYASMTSLDMVSLLLPPSANTNSATFLVPSSLINKCTIDYTIGTSSGSLTPLTTTPTISWSALSSGTYWLKATVTDQSVPTHRREFAQKIIIP